MIVNNTDNNWSILDKNVILYHVHTLEYNIEPLVMGQGLSDQGCWPR